MNPGPVTSSTPARDSLRTPWFLGALVLALMWWTLDLAILRAGVPHPADDHWEDHLIAERLIAGDGFRTTMIYPPLWGLRDAHDTIPVLVHGPLLAVLTAPALAAFGRDALESVAVPAALLALAALIPIYRIAARHFGAPVGAAAAGLFTLSPLTLEAVHHSGSVIVGAALLTWAIDLVARPAPRGLAAGLVAGLASLVRPEALLALPVLGALGWQTRRTNLQTIVALAAGFAACALPWWIYRTGAVGSPFFNLTSYTLVGFWGARPDVSVMQDFTLTPERWPSVLRAELPGIAGKWISFAPRALKHVLFTPSGATGWLAIVGLAAAASGQTRVVDDRSGTELSVTSARRLAWCSALLVLVPVAAMTLTFHQPLYLVPFAPLLAIGAAAGAASLANAMPTWARRPRAWIGLTLLLLLPSALPALRGAASEARVLERRLASERQTLARDFPRDEPGPRVIFSDSPDFVAWVTGRPALWTTEQAFAKLYAPNGAAADLGLPPPAEVSGYFHDDFRNPAAVGRRVVPGTGR